MSRADVMAILRRSAVSLGLLAGVLLATGLAQLYLDGRTAAVQRQIHGVQDDIRELRDRLDRLRAATRFVEARRAEFRRTLKRGFLVSPDPLQASKAIETLAESTGLNVARYTFMAPQSVVLGEGRGRDAPTVRLQAMPITIELDAVIDADIFAFLGRLPAELPGFVVLRTLDLSRQTAALDIVLGRFAEGERPAVVTGTAELDWVVLDIQQPDRVDGAPESGSAGDAGT